MDLADIGRRLAIALDANRRPGFTGDVNDVQALCVTEEAGELVKAYRRWAGKARKSGPFEDVQDEVADVLIVTSTFAARLGIDIDAAVEKKKEIIYARGWWGKNKSLSPEEHIAKLEELVDLQNEQLDLVGEVYYAQDTDRISQVGKKIDDLRQELAEGQERSVT